MFPFALDSFSSKRSKLLCLNEKESALDNRIPSRIDACINSSNTIVSPLWGMVENNPKLATYPELNKSPDSVLWKLAISNSNLSTSEVFPDINLDPVEPNLLSFSWSFEKPR